MCDSPDQEAHYQTLGPKLGASSVIRDLAGLGVKAFFLLILLNRLKLVCIADGTTKHKSVFMKRGDIDTKGLRRDCKFMNSMTCDAENNEMGNYITGNAGEFRIQVAWSSDYR
jgi:hypothetical protein